MLAAKDTPLKPTHMPSTHRLLVVSTVSLLLSACAAQVPSEPPPPFGTYPEGAEGPCADYFAELKSGNDAGASGEIYDLNDPAIQERLTRGSVRTRVNPSYPDNALRNGQNGEVVLGGIIDRGGRISDIKVLVPEPVRGFNEVALESLRQWTFQPAQVDGRFVRSYYCTRIRFSLVG